MGGKIASLKVLKTDKSIKMIMALAIPAMLENTLQVFIGVVDTYFIGKIGTEAIAGAGITNLTMNMYIAFFLALGVGTTAIVSRNIGAANYEEANNAVKQSLIMGVFISLIFGTLNLVFSKNILMLLGAEEKVIQYALPYFLSVAVPSVFLCIMMILSSALRGTGDTKTPMKVVLIANIVNAVLDYVLIFGFGFGILGAGLATTLARIVGVVLLLKKIKSKETKIYLSLSNPWKINKNMLKSIIKISLPAAVERLIMRSGQLIYGGMIIKISTEAYVAHNIAGTIEAFSYLPGMGFGVAAATLVGQSLGARKDDEAKKFGWMAYFLATGFMMVVGMIFYIFAPFLAQLFTKDDTVIHLVVKVLRIIALFQPLLCATLVITSSLQGAGDTKFPMYVTLIGIWGVRILGVYILGMKLELGLVGVWLAYAIDVTIRGVILMIRFLKGNWRKISIG
ncbi:putative efflux protein, MATE family [Clostridium aceticum]|uniref:Probable multidrug resistance protein NorM n=1 Tax=Clostridium aceticum TaxID=84022 RepID=A0A0D8IDZ2_9CLOT|nr:MATE family efflux transporter [Clostridium aceticum]AKL96429.1 putative efflux protein, MATE family [Clostridium aceticum]KJF27396.1 multidrug transporter MATE [Clostridium aceticum]